MCGCGFSVCCLPCILTCCVVCMHVWLIGYIDWSCSLRCLGGWLDWCLWFNSVGICKSLFFVGFDLIWLLC